MIYLKINNDRIADEMDIAKDSFIEKFLSAKETINKQIKNVNIDPIIFNRKMKLIILKTTKNKFRLFNSSKF